MNPKVSTSSLTAKHDNPFRPSNPGKQGYNRTINKFPEYKDDPIHVAVRKFEDPSKKREPYRYLQ